MSFKKINGTMIGLAFYVILFLIMYLFATFVSPTLVQSFDYEGKVPSTLTESVHLQKLSVGGDSAEIAVATSFKLDQNKARINRNTYIIETDPKELEAYPFKLRVTNGSVTYELTNAQIKAGKISKDSTENLIEKTILPRIVREARKKKKTKKIEIAQTAVSEAEKKDNISSFSESDSSLNIKENE
ncbi:hypothetical protein [Neptuniibacter sp. QD37_11]|uniref:hypothetical protein n=1 Tax=Neptuniibacter sp. QD37_11 TaxID=3398209 RepID=UPI0039F4C72C